MKTRRQIAGVVLLILALGIILSWYLVSPPLPRGYKELTESVRRGDTKTAEALIASGIDVNIQPRRPKLDTIFAPEYYSAPIHVAAGIGDPKMIHMLLRRGANPNLQAHRYSHGSLPLEILAWGASSLTLFKSDPAGNHDLETRLKEYVESARLLIDAGARSKTGDNVGSSTILAETVKSGSKVLLTEMLRIDHSNYAFYSGLKAAEIAGNDEAFTELASRAGKDALTLGLYDAVRERRTRYIESYLKAGADPNQLINDRESVLQQAAAWGDRYTIQMLFKYGGRHDIKNNSRHIPAEAVTDSSVRE